MFRCNPIAIHSAGEATPSIPPFPLRESASLFRAAHAVAGIAAFTGVAAFAALAALPLPVHAADKVHLGHLADYSGPTSDVGVPYGQGVDDAFAWINKNGGVAGRQLDVETVDYSYQVPRALATYKKWVGQGDIVAIQGWGTADTEALVGFLTQR